MVHEEGELQQRVLADLLASLDIQPQDHGCELSLTGADPVVPGRHRIGLASAAALAAHGAGVAAIWRQRSGRSQNVSVDIRQAGVIGLRTGKFITQNGYDFRGQGANPALRNFFPTKDGRRMYLMRFPIFPRHLAELLDCLGCTNDSDEQLASAVARRGAEELENELASRKLIATYARTREEWLAHPQGAWLNARAPADVTRIADSEPEPFVPGPRPLSGLRVLDMTHVIAGPVCSRTLAEQGADVLHVETPAHPDSLHNMMDTAIGKRCCYLDLERAEDLQRLHALIREADVFVQSWRPGSLDRFGLSPEAVAKLRPGIVYVSVSCYGSQGPWRTRAGYEPLGQAACGLSVAEGSADAPKMVSTFTLNDYLAAYLGAAGVTSALLKRASTGGSHHVEVSLTRCSMWVQELGELPAETVHAFAAANPRVPGAKPGDLMTLSTVFGAVQRSVPIALYSDTPARWDTGPFPAGSSGAYWLPR